MRQVYLLRHWCCMGQYSRYVRLRHVPSCVRRSNIFMRGKRTMRRPSDCPRPNMSIGKCTTLTHCKLKLEWFCLHFHSHSNLCLACVIILCRVDWYFICKVNDVDKWPARGWKRLSDEERGALSAQFSRYRTPNNAATVSDICAHLLSPSTGTMLFYTSK